VSEVDPLKCMERASFFLIEFIIRQIFSGVFLCLILLYCIKVFLSRNINFKRKCSRGFRIFNSYFILQNTDVDIIT